MSAPIRVELPLQLVNPTNEHAHWRRRSTRTAVQRKAVWLALQAAGAQSFFRETPGPWRVSFERRSPRPFDSDGLVAACKGLRDGIAELAGVDDRSSSWRWSHRWASARVESVVIQLESGSASDRLLEVIA